MADNTATEATRPNPRKVREGLVTSNAMDKTAVVSVTDRVRHPRYAKTVQRTTKLYVHDEANDLNVGDRVRIGTIELVVRAVSDARITEVGIELEPRALPTPSLRQVRAWLRRALARSRRWAKRLRGPPWNESRSDQEAPRQPEPVEDGPERP